MKRFVLVAGLLAATPALALLDQSAPGIVKQSGQFVSAGAGQMALAVTTATTLTVPAGSVIAQICVEGATVRYRDDGTNPTTTRRSASRRSSCTKPCTSGRRR